MSWGRWSRTGDVALDRVLNDLYGAAIRDERERQRLERAKVAGAPPKAAASDHADHADQRDGQQQD